MSRKSLTTESFTTKPSRNDRFAQMSRQEQIIEQKKREIQARLQQQKEKPKPPPSPATTTKSSSTTAETKKATKTLWKGNLGNKPNQNANNKSNAQFNIFSNDGSFLDQFKQMNDGSSSSSSSSSSKKGFDQNIANSSITPDNTRDSSERSYSDERNKPSRWSKSRNQPMPFPPDDTSLIPPKISRFSDPPPDIHQIVPSYAPNFTQSEIFTNNFTVQPPITAPVSVPPPNTNSVLTNYPVVTSAAPLLLPPPLTIPGIPPPQIVQANNVGALIAPPPPHTNISNQTMTGISVPPPILSVAPPPCVIELTSIPAPTPIPLHTIPQPEPINTLTIPPPAPLQLQNIPSPSPIRLNEIPNPKPIDLLNIPAPGDKPKLGKMTNPDFIKNVPPPNKSVPPPNMGTVNVTELPNITIPPPNTSQAIPPTSVPPPILTHHHHAGHHVQVTNAHVQTLIGAVSSASIPSLMAQPILPPPGMARTAVQPPSMQTVGVVSQSMVNLLPPPVTVTVTALPGPPPVLNQPPPLAQTNQIPPMNFPPPLGPPPTVLVNVNAPPPGIDTNAVCPPGSTSHDAMVSLGRMVAQCGSGIEDIVQQRSAQDPSLWFLFHKNSAAYQQYRQLVEQFRAEYGPNGQNQNQKQQEAITEYQPEDIYEPDCITDDELQGQDCNMSCADQNTDFDNLNESARKRKRKSRWGEKVIETAILVQSQPCLPNVSNLPMLSKVTRTDPGLIQYAINTFGSSNLSEEDWNKAEDHYKINLLYQEMVRKREEIEMLQRAGRNKYEYDSDEETDGGTWEHKLRMQEMEATQLWANELTRQAEGKHHIGDFLPPDELKKFMEKYSAAKEGRQPNLSDYKEFKLKEDNIGFKMLQKLGWQEGQGLGSEGTGIVDPVNKATSRDSNQGLGLQQSDGIGNTDDEYDAYRKRMMLAYRFRPNPLNNPRRPYY